MRDYSVVSPRFWIGETGKALRGNAPAQVLALYLMTCPHANMIGVFHCPVLYMAHETGLGLEGASEGLRSLIEAGFCTYEPSSEIVFVHRMASFQVADELKPADNRVKSVIREWENIGSDVVRAAFHAIYAVAFHLPETGKKRKHLTRGSKAPSKPRTGTGTGTGIPPKPPEGVDGLFEQFWTAYPRKTAKDSARKAFEKREPDEALLSTMLAAIAAQAKSLEWTKDAGQFIPHPATWLNAGRWMDEGTTAAQASTAKRGSDEYAAVHRNATWWRDAGFGSVWEADAAKCWHDTAQNFHDGKRIEVAA